MRVKFKFSKFNISCQSVNIVFSNNTSLNWVDAKKTFDVFVHGPHTVWLFPMGADHAYGVMMFKYVRLIISALLARHRLRALKLLKHLKGMMLRQLMNRWRQLMNILSTSDYSKIKPAPNLSTKDRDHLSRVHEHHAVYVRTPLWNTREDELWDSLLHLTSGARNTLRYAK